MNEQQIIRGIKKGDGEAMKVLMDQLNRPVYALCYKIIGTYGTKEDVEEAVSDTFIRVWGDIDKYNEKLGNFETWIFMLAKYKALTIKRRKERERSRTEVLVDTIPERNFEKEKDLWMDIDLFTEGLSKEERQLFVRRFFLEDDIEEIAELLQLKRAAVDTRLWRLRKGIKAFFTMEGGKNNGQ